MGLIEDMKKKLYKKTVPEVPDNYWSHYDGKTPSRPADSSAQKNKEQSAPQAAPTSSVSSSDSGVLGVNKDLWDAANQQFQYSDSVNAAADYLKNLDQQLSGHKPSDDLISIRDQILGAEPFSYDFSQDPMFQNMLALYQSQGKMAMEDTLAQASGLTGGYANSWAQTAGQQAYNQSLQEAYNNLPAYYQLALDSHNMERDELLRRYNLLSEEEQKEYDRLLNQYGIAYDQLKDLKQDERSLYDVNNANLWQQIGVLNSEAVREQERSDKLAAESRARANALADRDLELMLSGYTKDANGNWVAPEVEEDKEWLYENVVDGLKAAYERYVTEDGDETRFKEFVEELTLDLSAEEINALLAAAGISRNYATGKKNENIDISTSAFLNMLNNPLLRQRLGI